jgi:hypothetical protein
VLASTFQCSSQCWPGTFLVQLSASPVLVQAPLRFHPSVGPSGSPSASPVLYPMLFPAPDRVMVPMATLVALPVLNLALLPVRLPVFVLVLTQSWPTSSPSVMLV